jgi:hypothetical protein
MLDMGILGGTCEEGFFFGTGLVGGGSESGFTD